MPAGSVIVRDLDSLDTFGKYLTDVYEQLNDLCGALESACADQSGNWQDEQYEEVKSDIDDFISACKSELENLNSSARRVADIVSKLRDL